MQPEATYAPASHSMTLASPIPPPPHFMPPIVLYALLHVSPSEHARKCARVFLQCDSTIGPPFHSSPFWTGLRRPFAPALFGLLVQCNAEALAPVLGTHFHRLTAIKTCLRGGKDCDQSS